MSSRQALPTSIPGVATLHEIGDGLSVLRIATALSTAEIALQGAHVFHFQPANAGPVLFLSRSSFLAPGKPIRGGIPVCFPWFSARAGRPESPAHGFARTLQWEVESLSGSAGEGVTVVLRLSSDEQTRAHWPHDFSTRLRIALTRELSITLEVENTGHEPFEFEEALHTYFAVSDVREISARGLEGAAYLDKTDGFQRKQLGSEPLRFVAETDRVFPQTKATCTIDDPTMNRQIVIEKSGSESTVVWNPWATKAAALPDLAEDEWPHLLCIETANIGSDAITLAPGSTHAMHVSIRLA